MNHKIKRQVFEISLQGTVAPFALQQQMSETFYEHILPVLERVFDRYAGVDTIVQIDQMEVNMGLFTEKQFAGKEWLEALEQQLEEQLLQLLAAPAGSTIRFTTAFSAFEQWMFYMRHGHLPWNATWPDQQWLQQVLEVLAAEYTAVTQLRHLIVRNLQARKRMAQQHDEHFLSQLVTIITAKDQQPLVIAIKELYHLLTTKRGHGATDVFGETAFLKAAWQSVLLAAAQRPALSFEELFVMIIRQYLSPEEMKSVATNKEMLTGSFSLLPGIRKRLKEKSDTGPQIEDVSRQEQEPEETVRELFVSNAGAVILHPFLSAVYSKLGWWTKNKKFNNETAQQKAVLLLHYLITGRTTAAEWETPVPKILCAWPLQKALDAFVRLTEEEQEEADMLLQVVISHWEKIKNTSPDGLRAAFLQRSGKLYWKSDAQHLQVEANSIDVLLDYLPWGLSIIRLPWMKEVLWVEWR